MKPIPPEIVNNLIEIVTYLAAAAVGWIAKLLQGKKTRQNGRSGSN